MSKFKLSFFLILWFFVGVYIIPTFLKRQRRFLTNELLLVLCIGLCFSSMVIASTCSGFSSALGAFCHGLYSCRHQREASGLPGLMAIFHMSSRLGRPRFDGLPLAHRHAAAGDHQIIVGGGTTQGIASRPGGYPAPSSRSRTSQPMPSSRRSA